MGQDRDITYLLPAQSDRFDLEKTEFIAKQSWMVRNKRGMRGLRMRAMVYHFNSAIPCSCFHMLQQGQHPSLQFFRVNLLQNGFFKGCSLCQDISSCHSWVLNRLQCGCLVWYSSLHRLHQKCLHNVLLYRLQGISLCSCSTSSSTDSCFSHLFLTLFLTHC